MHLGVVVGERDPWRFFEDIYADLMSHYQVELFRVRRPRLPFFYERVARQLLRYDLDSFMKRQDVVFFEWASGLLAAASHLPKRCPLVVRLHRYEMFEWSSKVNWDAVDKVIFVSQALESKFVGQYPAQRNKTVVIPVGIATGKFQTNRAEPAAGNIGTLCNLTPRKRVYELILAFQELSQTREGLHLHIGGASDPAYQDYYDSMRRLVEKLGLENQVTFYGEIEKPWEWFRNVDVFVSNSYSEGLQVALMEAMASGCYCVSHHWDGVEELLPEEHLFYRESELKEKILNYLDAPYAVQFQHRERMRRIACGKVDAKQIQSRIRRVIEQVAQESLERTQRRNDRVVNLRQM